MQLSRSYAVVLESGGNCGDRFHAIGRTAREDDGVDVMDALHAQSRQQPLNGKVTLEDPAVTLALLQLSAAIGVTFF